MKKLFIVTIFCLATQFQAMANLNHVGTIGWGACSKDMQVGTLKSLNTTLSQLVATNEFKNQEVFKTKIANIQNLSLEEQTVAYFKLAGVVDSKDLAELIGEDIIPNRFIQNIEMNLSLSNDQAEKIARNIRKALLGTRQ